MKQSSFTNVAIGSKVEWVGTDGPMKGEVVNMVMSVVNGPYFAPFLVIDWEYEPGYWSRGFQLSANTEYLESMRFRVVENQ